MSDVDESDVKSNQSDEVKLNVEDGLDDDVVLLEENDKPLEELEGPTSTPLRDEVDIVNEEDEIKEESIKEELIKEDVEESIKEDIEESIKEDVGESVKEEIKEEENEDLIDPDDGGGADTDFIVEDSGDIQFKEEDDLQIHLRSTYLLILFKSDKYKDYIGEIISADEDSFILDNADSKSIKVNMTDRGLVLDDGTIVKEMIRINLISDLETLLDEEDIFKEESIKLDLLEVDKQHKKYNESEIKEDFISEIVNLYNIFDSESLIKKITNMSYSFFDLIRENQYISDIDRTDVLSFIKKIENDNEFKLPNYILPIVSLKKKLFSSEDEVIVEKEDNSVKTYESELIEKYTLMNADNTGYIKTLNIIFDTEYNSYITRTDKYGIQINYDGRIIRDCLNDLNPCQNFINKDYYVDMLKSRSEFYTMDDGEKNVYVDSNIYNIIGLLFLPEEYSKYSLKLQLKNKYFNLYENVLLCDRGYSTVSFRQALVNKDIIFKNINNESLKNEYEKQINAFMFDLDKNINLEELSELLSKTLPDTKSIINSLNKDILKHLYNFNDFEKLLILYNISINDLLYDDKNEIIDLIKDNINNYEKTYKKILKSVIKPIKKLKIINKELDISDKIKLVKEYIFSTKNIEIKKELINKFIKIYCREASNEEEDINWLYSTDTNEKILCKHYYYSTKIDNEHPEYYEALRSIFCPESDDGNVCCAVCGHLIDNVEFSTFGGYSDGNVINMHAKLDNELVNKNISEGNEDLKEEINNMSKKFNIKLYQDDLESIVNILNIVDDTNFMNYRYGVNNFNNNIYIKKINEIHHIDKTKSKKENDSNKKKIKKTLKYFKIYLLKYNKLLLISFLIFIHIQISINTYKINLNDMYNILIYDVGESWKNLSIAKDDSSINKRMLQYIEIHLEEDLNNLTDNVDHKEYLDKIKFKNQFIKTVKYLLKPQFNLYSSINKYFKLNKNLDNIFVKESWPNFKPLYDNKLVLDINRYISSKDNEFKQYFINNDSLENISLLKDINRFEPKYIEYKLSISDLMNNPSYKRLYMYSLKLYGKSRVFPILNLLAKQFINTVNDEGIKQLLIKCDYTKDGFKSINYNKFKEVIIGDITKYEIEHTKDKDNIVKFKHINLNNTEYILLNCNSRGGYRYEPSKIFIDSSFEELISENTQFVEKVFNNYCIDGRGDLIENLADENILNYYLLDYREDLKQNLSECKKTEIQKDIENFQKIMDYLPNKNKLQLKIFIEYTEKYTNDDIFEFLNFNTEVEDRLLSFFNENKYLDYDDDKIFMAINEIILNIKQNKTNKSVLDNSSITDKLDNLYEPMKSKSNDYLKNIESLYNEIINEDEYYNEYNKLQLTRLKNIVRKTPSFMNDPDKDKDKSNNIEKTYLLIDRLTEDIQDGYVYKRFIDDMFFTINRLKNKYRTYNLLKRKSFKLSDTNIDEYNKYIDINEFMLHNDLFFQRKKNDLKENKKYSGFKDYKEEENTLYFEGLYDYINKYNINLHKLKGSSNNILNPDILLSINRFIFVFIINKIVEYIQSLLDPESDIYKIATSKYQEMNDENICIKNSIICLSRFLLDLIINMYEKYYDTIWVYVNSGDLNMSIMKQLSREKHTYLQKTQGMTKEQKKENDMMNDMGKGTLYKDFEQDNQNYALSHEFEQDIHPEESNIETIDVKEGYEQHLYDQEENGEMTENDL